MFEKKILITSTDLMMLQFLLPHVENLLHNGYQVDVACSNVGKRIDEVAHSLNGKCRVFSLCLHRHPAKIENLKGLYQLKRIIKDGNYNLVWTNEPVMGVMTRLASIAMRKKGMKVIYMVHGYHFYNGAPWINWLLYYPIEKLMSYWTDLLITMNQEDYKRAFYFHAGNVLHIHGIGIDIQKAEEIQVDRLAKRRELEIPENAVLLLSVGELSKRKNHAPVIKVLAELKNENIYYVIAGQGKLKKKLEKLSRNLGVERQIQLLGYRKDVLELYKASDIFVFPSKQEGLPVALMEAMASGLPCIVSDIRGNRDLIQNRKNGICCSTEKVSIFASEIKFLIEKPDVQKMYIKNSKEVLENYSQNTILKRIIQIYGDL